MGVIPPVHIESYHRQAILLTLDSSLLHFLITHVHISHNLEKTNRMRGVQIMDAKKALHPWQDQTAPHITRPKDGILQFSIRTVKDYHLFFAECLSDGLLKSEYCGSTFHFYIHLEISQTQKVDEQLFFYLCLIANQFGTQAQFYVVVKVNQTYQEFTSSSDFFRLGTYLMLQLATPSFKSIQIQSNDGIINNWPPTAVKGLQNLIPLFKVNGKLLSLLQQPITENSWKRILTANGFKMRREEDILYYLCHRFLFDKIKNETCLSRLRTVTFRLQDFYNAIQGIPLLALLIFSVFDYRYRTDLAARYKNEIKSEKGTSVRLSPSDFLNELQDIQKYAHYQAHRKLQKSGLDNKTLLNFGNYVLYRDRKGKATNKVIALRDTENGIGQNEFLDMLEKGELNRHLTLHPQLVGELYEAIMVTEGLLQLLENTVFHAAQWDERKQCQSQGKGLLSIHIHHCDLSAGRKNGVDDQADMEKNYPSYMEQQRKAEPEPQQPRYYLEIKIADLSTTDIARKFKENRRDFIEKSPLKKTFTNFQLKSFFAPNSEENRAWENFYQESEHVINHYGLQIFNSIVRSKNGFFYVTSQNSCYNSQKEKEILPYTPFITGTSYAILLPLHASYTNDKNIYDSMLGYDMGKALSSPPKSHWYDPFPSIPKSITAPHIKEGYIFQLYQHFNKAPMDSIRVIDVSRLDSIECAIKGLIRYIYNHPETPAYFALINCKAHEIVNIVRLISLFYNRQAENRNMRQVQIYIRGKNVGEELLLFGEKLPEVENNIAKIACMRGILYENYRVLHDIFRRDSLEGGPC